MNNVEDQVREFYDSYGWRKTDGVSGEDALFRHFSPPYYPYHEGVNARTLRCFADLNGRLLMAGGGDLPETHVTIANQFAETTCLDISKVAVDIARAKLEGKGEFVVGSILDIPKDDGHFDAVYCAHVIYHIDKDQQSTAIREFIRITKPGGRIVIVYANPNSLPDFVVRLKERTPVLRTLRRAKPCATPVAGSRPSLYYFAHPLNWWSQFEDACEVAIKPWDVMGNSQEEVLLFNDTLAALGYRFCAWCENTFPRIAARWWKYPLVVLTKKPRPPRTT